MNILLGIIGFCLVLATLLYIVLWRMKFEPRKQARRLLSNTTTTFGIVVKKYPVKSVPLQWLELNGQRFTLWLRPAGWISFDGVNSRAILELDDYQGIAFGFGAEGESFVDVWADYEDMTGSYSARSISKGHHPGISSQEGLNNTTKGSYLVINERYFSEHSKDHDRRSK